MKKIHLFYLMVIFLILASLLYAGVDSSKVQIATKDGSFVAAANPLPMTTRFSLFSTAAGLKVNTNGSFINITSETIFARQSGTWFTNITGVNGSVRARQSGNWTVIPNSSSFSTIFNSNTSGFGSFKNLSGYYSKHAWQIKSTKHSPDVTWTIQLHQSLDGIDSESADTFTTATSFSIRNIVEKPTAYIRARVVQRTYTSTRPTITIKTRSGGN